MTLQERTCVLRGVSRGIVWEFGGGSVAVDDRSFGAVPGDIGGSAAVLARVDVPDIGAPGAMYGTHDLSGPVEMPAINARVENTASEGEQVLDLNLGGASGFTRTSALELAGEGSRHVTGRMPGIGGVAR
jgi:hypothetical protein